MQLFVDGAVKKRNKSVCGVEIDFATVVIMIISKRHQSAGEIFHMNRLLER